MNLSHHMTCLALVLATLISSPSVLADAHAPWILKAETSRLAYGSIKNNVIGEVNYFRKMSGHISAKGEVDITINLSSVETNVGIRNERMIKHVFEEGKLSANLSTTIDLKTLSSLSPGKSKIINIEGKLSFLGKNIPIQTSIFLARLDEHQLLASTNDMVMLNTANLGVDEGISALKSLAKLAGITRVSPVTMRLVFERGAHTHHDKKTK